MVRFNSRELVGGCKSIIGLSLFGSGRMEPWDSLYPNKSISVTRFTVFFSLKVMFSSCEAFKDA